MSADRTQAPSIRSAQWIVLFMAGGVLSVTAIAIALRFSLAPEPSEFLDLLPVVVGGLALSTAVVYALLRRQFFARALAQRAEGRELVKENRLPTPLYTLTVIGAALAEGVGMMGAITVLLGGSWFMLAAPALALLLILAQLPTRGRVERSLRG